MDAGQFAQLHVCRELRDRRVIRLRSLLALLLLVLLAACVGIVAGHLDSALAQQQEDPHEGQPKHCSNAKTAPKAHKCDCKKTADACDIEDVKCRVYCRKNKCYCFHPSCDS